MPLQISDDDLEDIPDSDLEELPPNYGARPDGTKKGSGFSGPLNMQDGSGNVATEMSIGVNLDGKEIQIPTLVPTMSAEQRQYILDGGDPRERPDIINTATSHAINRIKVGKSPYIEPDETSQNVLKNPLYRIGRGAMTPFEGLLQMSAYAAGIGEDTIDNYINEKKQQDEGANPGVDLYRTFGESFNPLTLGPASILSKAISTSTALPRFVKAIAPGIVSGYTTGLTNPVIGRPDYAKAKEEDILKNVGVSSAIDSTLGIGKSAFTRMINPFLSKVSGSPLNEVYDTFAEAGSKGRKAYNEFNTGNANQDELVTRLENTASTIKAASREVYNKNMEAVAKDAKVLPFNSIYKALDDARANYTHKGYEHNPEAIKTVGIVKDIIDEYKSKGPEYHDAIGMDALKRRLKALKSGFTQGKSGVLEKPTLSVVDAAISEIDRVIKHHSPIYKKTMSQSSDALSQLEDIRHNLSIGKDANTQTVLNKVNSALSKPHVVKILNQMEKQTGEKIIPSMAGYLSKEWANPKSNFADLAIAGGGMYTNPLYALSYLGMRSPKIMSSLYQGAGSLDRVMNKMYAPDILKQMILHSTDDN